MNGYTRRQELTCTLEELATYPDKVLLNNEALYVIQANGSRSVKFGDGVTSVADLPYSMDYSGSALADIELINTQLMVSDDIKGTRQTVTLNEDGTIQMIVHDYISTSEIVRTDVFTYAENIITEVRTLTTGETLTFTVNTDTLLTEVV